MSSEMVDFAVDGTAAPGYLAVPASGSGAGVLVLQEWWGLVPQIKGVCDRLAAAGFTALAPDLYHGEMAEHTEMDKAGELMTNLPADRAARDMSGAVTFLLEHDACTSAKVGVVGFCMGGMLALRIAAIEGGRIGVAAPFYGAPLGDDSLDWSNLSATVAGHFAENDDFFGPEPVKTLEAQLKALGKDVDFRVHPGTGHGFTNEENPLGSYDPATTEAAWTRTLTLLATL